VIVRDPAGIALGWGIYNGASRLAVRVVTDRCETLPTAVWLRDRVASAIDARSHLLTDPRHTTFRLFFGEADGIPGVVIDLFGTDVVIQVSGAFAYDNIDAISRACADALAPYGPAPSLYRAHDDATLAKEGVDRGEYEPDATAMVRETIVRENALEWIVLIGAGQKTGHFCDQRENRSRVARRAIGARVLDCFSYHGGFALTALAHGARDAVCVDSSADAVACIREIARLHVVAELVTTVRGDVFECMRSGTVAGRRVDSFDLVVLDPPKLVGQRRDLDAGLRAYKDLNVSTMRGMRSGARLATFSCSGAVSREEFRRVLAWAASDLRPDGRRVVIEESYSQPSDHPVPLSFPEAEYLKGFLLRIE
jgi:23S rRNA (cytosine1962-C5)-methyltransferase